MTTSTNKINSKAVPSTSRRKYPYHLEFEFSPMTRTFSIQRGTYSLRAG
jgi:hypothetical protein